MDGQTTVETPAPKGARTRRAKPPTSTKAHGEPHPAAPAPEAARRVPQEARASAPRTYMAPRRNVLPPAGVFQPEAPPEPAAQDSARPAPTGPQFTRSEALKILAERASSGDPSALEELREFLDSAPEAWRHVGDLASVAERAWAELAAGGDALAFESVRRHVAQLKSDLAGPSPTPLERLLVDVVGVAWLAAQHGEITATEVGGSLQQAAFRLRKAESGQRRLLSAVKALATVRALLPRGLVLTPSEEASTHTTPSAPLRR